MKISRCKISIRRLSLGVLALTLCLIANSYSQTPGIQPAMIGPSTGLTDMGIAPNDLDSIDALAVRCQTFVETDGSLTNYLCTSDDGIRDRAIIRKVADRLSDETFSPAMIRGQEVRVLMNFSVLISCAAAECISMPVPNHAYHIGALGINYVAPQPIVPSEHWYDGFEDRGPRYRRAALVLPSESGIPSGWFTAAVDVDSEGVASASCLYALVGVDRDNVRKENQKRLESILSELVDTSYVPGFVAGAPVPMRFFESSNVRVQIIPPNGGQAFATPSQAPELYCGR